MSDDVQSPRPWDLDQYHVSAARERREAARVPASAGGGGGAGGGGPGGGAPAAAVGGDYIEPGQRKQRVRYVDDASLFWTALTGAVLSILTVGLYRFWLITALRRRYAGAIRIDGDPIEYTGTGFEKLIGFLIALTFLAVYLGIANVLLLFLGIISLEGDSLFAPFSLIAVAPFVFWGMYRAQQYMMARLRWRGIRFGLEAGGWGYMWRSVLWAIAALATAGLLYPYMHFRQAKYIADRSFFGDIRFRQDGTWLGLLGYWIWLYIGGGLIFLAGWGIAEEMKLGADGIGFMITLVTPLVFLAIFFLFMNYQIGSFRYLWDHRSLGPTVIENDVGTRNVIWTHLRGSFLVSTLTGILAIVIGIALIGGTWAAFSATGGQETLMRLLGNDPLGALAEEELPPAGALVAVLPFLVAIGATYFLIFAVSYAFTQTLITQPVLKLKVEGMLLRNPEALTEAAQRRHEGPAEAGGFADALGVDMGAGFG